jgi:NADH-quinone oxidoreductase subunit A
VGQYLPVVLLAGLAVVFGILSFGASRLLAPRRPSEAKEAPYECGIVPAKDPPGRFPVGFYIVAMLFIMFDIEIIFVYPFAVSRSYLGMYGFVAIVIFSVLFFLTFVYEVARGGLDWGPLTRSTPVGESAVAEPASVDAGMVSATRTTSSTIRRVGTEGRPGAEPGEAA